MKHLRSTFFIVMALLVVLAACAPKATPVVVLVTATTAPTDTPAATEAPPSATATLEPINLLPPMKVGSTFIYVDGSILVAVPGGKSMVGRAGGSINPLREISLPDFWIYRAKVTNQQYAWCVALGQCTPPDPNDNKVYQDRTHASDPVVGVTWEQAQAYCTFVHGRLPTEFEWEKTASWDPANNKQHLYPWGDGAPVCDLLNFNNCVGATTSVVKYPQGKSFYEALDMEGNVYEWTLNFFDPGYYRIMPADNPQGPESGTQKSVRSSGFKSNKDQVPAAIRFSDYPDHHTRDRGFRCVVEDPAYFAPLCQQNVLLGTGPAGGSGSSSGLDVECPVVKVGSVQLNCSDGGANVMFYDDHGIPEPGASPPQPSIILSATCDGGTTLDSNTKVYHCTSGGSASIGSACTFSGTGGGEPHCADHYNLNTGTGMCEWDGTGTTGENCPTGYTYDTTLNCCMAQPGLGVNYPACALGTALVEDMPGHFVCIPSSIVPPPVHDDTTISLPSCDGHNACPTTDPNYPDCGGGSCQPQICGREQFWCQSTCSCIGFNQKCP